MHAIMREFGKMVIATFDPVEPGLDSLTLADFLLHSSKASSYKNMLNRAHLSLLRVSKSQLPFKHTVKFESYWPPKNPRNIQGPHEVLKSYFLPPTHAMDANLFRDPHFVKRIAVNDRAQYVLNRLRPGSVATGDYTSFEATHHGFFLNIIEDFVRHMWRRYGEGNAIERSYIQTIRHQNKCKNKSFTATFQERLCSGLPWTSTFNSVLNLIVTSFCALYRPNETAEEVFRKFHDFPIVIEGDDSLFNVDLNDSQIINLNFERVGAIAKLEFFDNPRFASFCGIVVNEKFQLATDPIKVVCNFFVIPKKYSNSKESKKLALLKAKAYSYAVQYYNCPIVAHLCYNFVRRYRHIQADFSLMEVKYGLEQQLNNKTFDPKFIREPPNVPDDLRELVSVKFGLSPEYQRDFEKCLNEYGEGGNMDCPSHPNFTEKVNYSRRMTGLGPINPYPPPLPTGNFRDFPNVFGQPIECLPWREEINQAGTRIGWVFNPYGNPVPMDNIPALNHFFPTAYHPLPFGV